MASRSTYLGGALGGFEGRMLAAGDILARGAGPLLRSPKSLPWFPLYPEHIRLRAIPGPHDGYFRGELRTFFSSRFTVSAQSNRMGCRLEGTPVKRDAAAVVALSALTLPHALVRVIVAEQLYRAVSLLSHHPYHRE